MIQSMTTPEALCRLTLLADKTTKEKRQVQKRRRFRIFRQHETCTYHFPFCSQLKNFRTYHTKFIKKSASIHYELSESSEVMKLVNNLVKAPEMAITKLHFLCQLIRVGLIEEFVNDAVDTALDTEDIEEEIDEETAAQLPEAVGKQKDEAVAEGVDDEEELEEIRARLAEVGPLVPIFLLFHTLTAQEAGKGGANSIKPNTGGMRVPFTGL
ncbi:hypothetical protein ACJRO7_013632 [Eucalyptus globulus]|uniref:Uncharacterized protein n=1 Tax=Eucalyptus globulus TaxID=34317 RepID=A0ABD3KXH5_EUCGL